MVFSFLRNISLFIYHNLVHLSVVELLGYFHVLAIILNAVINSCTNILQNQCFCYTLFSCDACWVYTSQLWSHIPCVCERCICSCSMKRDLDSKVSGTKLDICGQHQ